MAKSGMIRKVIEEFCQWLISAKKESEAQVVDRVDWDQVDGLRQKLSTMKTKRNVDSEPTPHGYMTDIQRENTALSDRLTVGGRVRGGAQMSQQLFSPQQQIHESLYQGSAPIADDDWSLRQRRSYSAPLYEQPAAPPLAPDPAAVDESFFSYATESPVAESRRAQNAAADESYEPLMIGGMDFSIAPQSGLTEFEGLSELPPSAPVESPPLVQEPAPTQSPFVVQQQTATPAEASWTVPSTAQTRAPLLVPHQVLAEASPPVVPPASSQSRPLPNFGEFDASPSADSTSGTHRTVAPLQIQNILVRRDSSTGRLDVPAPEGPAAVQSVTQDLTELVPIQCEPDQIADSAPIAECAQVPPSKPAAYRFATAHQTLADASFGGTAP